MGQIQSIGDRFLIVVFVNETAATAGGPNSYIGSPECSGIADQREWLSLVIPDIESCSEPEMVCMRVRSRPAWPFA